MWTEWLRLGRNGLWASRSARTAPQPDIILVFGPTDRLLSQGYLDLVAQFPGAHHFGCSTGTTVEDTVLADDRIVALAIGFGNTPLRKAVRRIAGPQDSEAIGQQLGAELAAPDLRGVFVLSDGLKVNGSALVRGLSSGVGPGVVVSGGLAGDGAHFAQTVVMHEGAISANSIAAIGLYGDAIRIAHGTAGGWDEFGPRRSVTRSTGNVLFELDGLPALDLYERYLGEESEDLPASGLLYPLKIWDPQAPQTEVVRTILAIDREQRSVTFAGDVPQGWGARLMRGSFYRLTEGATRAAEHAQKSLAALGSAPSLCLLVSCVGRRLLMQQRTDDEVAAVRDVIGHAVPIAGFYSYGEIAPDNVTSVCALHNQTVTLTLLSEAA
jgi:hypothetical protein